MPAFLSIYVCLMQAESFRLWVICMLYAYHMLLLCSAMRAVKNRKKKKAHKNV